jgi:hypothetical protein
MSPLLSSRKETKAIFGVVEVWAFTVLLLPQAVAISGSTKQPRRIGSLGVKARIFFLITQYSSEKSTFSLSTPVLPCSGLIYRSKACPRDEYKQLKRPPYSRRASTSAWGGIYQDSFNQGLISFF